MSYSIEATRRRLPWWYLAVPFAAIVTWLLPYRWLLTDLRAWYLLPLWILVAHLHTSMSHALATGSCRKGAAFLRNTRLAYRSAGSLVHLQAALLVALAEETLFREAILWPLRDAVSSSLVALVATSLLFSFAHLRRRGRRRGARTLLDLFLLAVLLGALTLWTRSLYPAIVIHGWRNYLLRCLLISRKEWEALQASRREAPAGRSGLS